jgi:hypothetical protein
MSTTMVTYAGINSIHTKEVGVRELLTVGLTNNRVIDKNNIVDIYNNDGRMPIETAFSSNNKMMGSNNWLIMYKSDEILTTDEKLDKLRAELTAEMTTKITGLHNQIADLTAKLNVVTRIVVDELVETKLRNTACNIIMFFLGIQPAHKPPKSRRFADSDNQELLVKMIDACDIDRNPRKLGTNLDNLINDRNACIHPQTTSELYVDVVKCMEYIKQYPSLRTFEYETFVVEHYADFMKFAQTIL